MRRRLHLHPEDWRDGAHGPARTLVLAPEGGPRRQVEVAFLGARPEPLDGTDDALLLLALFHAMRRASEVVVHGTVSGSLLANLQRFMVAWHTWRPRRYALVPIQVRSTTEAEPGADGAVLTFSGGLDSCYSAWRHAGDVPESGSGGLALRTAVMVHGFDIPLAEPETFAQAAEAARAIAEDAGLAFVPVRCSVRELEDDWEDSHGAALAACLHLLRPGHERGVIAASHTHDTLRFPWGSNPRTDPLLGTQGFPIVYDGIEASRSQKARALSAWPVATARLRVCWQGPTKDRNCGRCVRCIGTALCFAVEGADVPEVLGVASLEEGVARLRELAIPDAARSRLTELAEVAHARGVTGPWLDALEAVVAKRSRASLLGRLRRRRLP